MNTTFDIHRFWNFLRWDFIQNYRSYITLALGACIVLIALYFFNSRMEVATSFSSASYSGDSMGEEMQNAFVSGYNTGYNLTLNAFGMAEEEASAPDDAAMQSPETADATSSPLMPSMYAAWATMVIVIVVTLYGARVFKQMQSRKGAIAFLMQPASRLEKFLGRTLTVLVMSFLCCMVAIVIADIVFLLISLATPSVNFSPVIVELFRATFGINEPTDIQPAFVREIGSARCDLFIYILGATLFSTYIIGGTLFSKRPMFITSLINCVVGVILITSAANILFRDVQLIQEEGINLGGMVTTATIRLAAIFVINIVLAYRFFCRRQIISC